MFLQARSRFFFQMIWLLILLLSLVACGKRGGSGRGDGCVFAHLNGPSEGRELGLADANYGGSSLAQSFTVSQNTSVTGVAVSLAKTGTLSDNHYVTVRLETDSAGPTGQLAGVGANGTLYLRQILTAPSWLRVSFSSAVPLIPAKYWIRLTASYPLSSANLVKWQAHDDSDALPDGQAMYLSGSGWKTDLIGLLRDALFTVYC